MVKLQSLKFLDCGNYVNLDNRNFYINLHKIVPGLQSLELIDSDYSNSTAYLVFLSGTNDLPEIMDSLPKVKNLSISTKITLGWIWSHWVQNWNSWTRLKMLSVLRCRKCYLTERKFTKCYKTLLLSANAVLMQC